MKRNKYIYSQNNLAKNKHNTYQRLVTNLTKQLTEIEQQKKIDIHKINIYTNNDPRERNHRKSGSEWNKRHIGDNNIATTIPTKQYMPDDTIIRTLTSNIHHLLPTTIDSNKLSNNICLQTELSANNNKLTQIVPSQKRVPVSYTTNLSSVTRHLQKKFKIVILPNNTR